MAPLRLGPISPAADGALYAQLVAAVKREVAAGRLPPGEPLPSVRALAAQLLVSIITVKRAYDELEREGVIFSRQGLGTFVAERAAGLVQRDRLAKTRTALAEAVREGRAAGLTDKDLQDALKKELGS
jgi:GntR family transcriptional regulator